jgi:Transglutaminase elicitor
MSSRADFLVVITCFALSCAQRPKETAARAIDSESARDAERWAPDREDPSFLLPDADTRLAYNIVKEDVGKTFGVPDDAVPFPDTYWPFVDEGIDWQWNSNEPSPLTKLVSAVNPSQLGAAKEWEKKNHGSLVPKVESWFGHCPGWTAAALLNKPIIKPVTAKFENGSFRACAMPETGCTRFEIGDINALMAESHVDSESRFIGARCDTKRDGIVLDSDGRVTNEGCKGLNAGTLLVILGNRMRHERKPFAINAQNDGNTDEIWNQPAFRYTVYRYATLTRGEAADIVKGTGSATNDYLWNGNARGFVFVDIGVWWVSERGPNTRVVSGLASKEETRFTAIIETDEDPSSPSAQIVGGEYVADEDVGTTRLQVAPFAWVALGTGPERPSGNGDGHNPYVSPKLVQQLVALGQ